MARLYCVRVFFLMCSEVDKIWGAGMKLTSREKEVLDLLMGGRTNKAIAQQLLISDFTVRDHVSSLLSKHGVGNRMALMVVVSRLGDNARKLTKPLRM